MVNYKTRARHTAVEKIVGCLLPKLLLLLNFIRTQKYNINEVQEKIQRVSKEKAIETTSRSQVIVDPYIKNRSWQLYLRS
jgi:hypothetical protein